MISDYINLCHRPHIFKDGKSQHGFTLLEIIVAMAIFAIIVSLIFPAYTGTYRNIDTAGKQAEIYQMARIALIRIIEDLESAYIPDASQNNQENDNNFTSLLGQNEDLDGRRADKIRFYSRSHINFGEALNKGGNAKIAYYPLLKDDETISLYRSDTPDNIEWPEDETEGWIICEGLYSISFVYRDKEGEPYDTWDETFMDAAKKFPAIVDITLEFIDEDNPEKPLTFSTAVFIPLTD